MINRWWLITPGTTFLTQYFVQATTRSISPTLARITVAPRLQACDALRRV